MPLAADIAIRASGAWLVGASAIVSISAHTARPSRKGPVSLWIGIAAVVAKFCLISGCIGVGLLLVRLIHPPYRAPNIALGGAGFIGSYWVSIIVIQIAQNVAYKIVGAPYRPIEWYRSGKRRRSRRKPRSVRPEIR